MADDDSFRLPLHCPLIVNGEEGKASSGRQFKRENPADIRQVATIAEQGTLEDARAAIDAARVAFDSNGPRVAVRRRLQQRGGRPAVYSNRRV